MNNSSTKQARVLMGGLICLFAVYGWDLAHLFQSSWSDELDSYIPLVPVICGYFVWQERKRIAFNSHRFSLVALGIGLAGLLCLALSTAGIGQALVLKIGQLLALKKGQVLTLNPGDRFSLRILSFVCLLAAIVIQVVGQTGARRLAFPLGFLVFLVPLPDGFKDFLTMVLQHSSAEVAYLFLKMTGTPIFREGLAFKLPNITMEVAPECSGIHSSLVLFITSIVAGQMLLRKPWHRAALTALVIPLGIARNGFRILVLGWLSANVDPGFIHSPLHHRGGPVFFALSLLPFFALLWYFRRVENRQIIRKDSAPSPAAELVR